ncbi:hypothetical protein MMF94_36890 [Pseudonocardia alaniniphila]|uniref:Uncharacterized protein n=1 Tax=Pseudonocardia alaniniphila TaxID=75291 RepID=A0ABS9TS00_9PSEU|nr:hypothetical protein [Pseudonocardia alaniniphila]MCH6171304.1 hypothetical protein [Pseudonocardia alaniniphila]
MTAGQIARRTHTPVKRVKVTTSVARSELAAAVLSRYDIPLDQVAVIAEFDDGSEKGVEAVKALTITAQTEPAQFDHVAQRLRDQREEQRLVAERSLSSPPSASGSSPKLMGRRRLVGCGLARRMPAAPS